jgi:biotin-dependent carboxylase-like uncharacterized protein
MKTITFNNTAGFLTLQDQGRIGYANIAVPTSGAFDQKSHQLANRLIGNFPNACAIESLRGSFEFSTDSELVISATGAPTSVQIDGREHEMFRSIFVPAGSVVSVSPGSIGMRTYLAIRGGIVGNQIMGSSSYDELSQIGTPPIKPGDKFSVENKVAGSITGDYIPGSVITGLNTVELEAMPAPRWSGFSNSDILFRSEYQVTSSVNRVGLRLSGPALVWNSESRLASEGVVNGAIQIPVDGMPLIFGPDHPTTGGYPVVAVVSRNSLDLLAQTAPGTVVRFKSAR